MHDRLKQSIARLKDSMNPPAPAAGICCEYSSSSDPNEDIVSGCFSVSKEKDCNGKNLKFVKNGTTCDDCPKRASAQIGPETGPQGWWKHCMLKPQGSDYPPIGVFHEEAKYLCKTRNTHCECLRSMSPAGADFWPPKPCASARCMELWAEVQKRWNPDCKSVFHNYNCCDVRSNCGDIPPEIAKG